MKLIETMRVSEDGAVYLLDRHLERLRSSASYFSFSCNSAMVRESILAAAAQHDRPARVRLLLSQNGDCDLEFEPLSSQALPRTLRFASTRVRSTDPLLCHKTTKRQIYEEARIGLDTDTDALLINERGEVTETTIANVAVLRGAEWITPPVSCGLLPGVMRADLLVSDNIVEGVFLCDDLVAGETIRCFNSVRGLFEATFVR